MLGVPTRKVANMNEDFDFKLWEAELLEEPEWEYESPYGPN